MRKVKYTGLRPMGTLTPRRMWRPGEILEVDDDIAKKLARDPNFMLVVKARSRRRREKA